MKCIQNLTLRLTRLLTVTVTVTAGDGSGGRGGDAIWKHAGDGHLGYCRGGKVALPSVQVRDQSDRGEGESHPNISAGERSVRQRRGGKVTLPSVQVRDQSDRGEGGKSPYHQCRWEISQTEERGVSHPNISVGGDQAEERGESRPTISARERSVRQRRGG